jgi:2,3-bisphosphoglycerate-independent phosphoglycerate mutase
MTQSLKGLSPRTLLIVLDGFGINPNTNKNAVRDANTPTIDRLFAHYPFTTIEAGGEPVGLPKGVPGNSEVGHMNLGAGKPVRQDLVRINEAIANGTFNDLPLLKEFSDKAMKGTKRIHLMGLLSDGGVHSHITHIKQVIQALSRNKDLQIFFHAFMDGRDTAQDVGARYIHDLQSVPGFTFASMQGRSLGMDRDRRWEKIKKAYDTFIGAGEIEEIAPADYLAREHSQGRFDEFVAPVLFSKNSAIQNGDSIFFLNFRPDRAIQLSLAFTDPNFKEFARPVLPGQFLCMTPYIPDEVPLPILFDKEPVPGGLSEYLSKKGLAQFKIAETEKYAHVTFFFNGGQKKPFPAEEQVLIPSPKEVSTYDQKPSMSAEAVTDRLITALENQSYRFYLVNFANADMVGHTGNYKAAIAAVEALDSCLLKLEKKCAEHGVAMIITADHGNSDQMVYEDGSPHTSHTGAPVPVCVVHPKLLDSQLVATTDKGALKDIAPTVLTLMGLPLPENFTGISLFN